MSHRPFALIDSSILHGSGARNDFQFRQSLFYRTRILDAHIVDPIAPHTASADAAVESDEAPFELAARLAELVGRRPRSLSPSADERADQPVTVLVLALSGSADGFGSPDLSSAELLASYKFAAGGQRPRTLRHGTAQHHGAVRRHGEAEQQRSTPDVGILPSAGSLSAGRIGIDLDDLRVRVGLRTVELTHQEFLLLKTFLQHPNRVLSRRQLLRLAWSYSDAAGGRTVDVHVRRLRVKLGADASHIVTVRGFGYRFQPDQRESPRPIPRGSSRAQRSQSPGLRAVPAPT